MIHADVIIVGGGAAGFFTAINAAEKNPDLKIIILERGKEVLTKVKVSGGGRCNVTHAEFLPKELIQNYPRGEKELLGPFHSFMTGDTIEWFSKRGVELKIEEDGRMFPVTDNSQTIIDCFVSETERLGIDVLKGQSVKSIERFDSAQQLFWKLETPSDEFSAAKLVIATGSNPKIWKLLEGLDHTIIPPVPSLFTFNIDDERIKELPGISTEASVKVFSPPLQGEVPIGGVVNPSVKDKTLKNGKTGLSNPSALWAPPFKKGEEILASQGPLLITHWGMSGPAILKLSAWGARLLEPTKYHFSIQVNWLLDVSKEDISETLKGLKIELAKKTVLKNAQFDLPKRLWQSLVAASEISETITWADISKQQINTLASQLTESRFNVHGKSTFKEEFVTAGGIELKEVDFKSFESKKHKNLYFAGEVLNIDAITGGFNFQNAWTGGFMAAQSIAR